MRKKVIKAHRGMAHVPKPSGQQTPSKAKGTAGTTPRPKRMIGLPQRFKRFRGGRRRATAPAPQAPPTVRPTRAMPEPAVIQQPKPVVRPPRQSDAGGGRGGRPVFELPNMGRGKPIQRKPIQRPKPQSFRVPASRAPKVIPKPMQPRIMKQGGYVSRAKYGIVDNLKGK